jgi:hypothetical protein
VWHRTDAALRLGLGHLTAVGSTGDRFTEAATELLLDEVQRPLEDLSLGSRKKRH